MSRRRVLNKARGAAFRVIVAWRADFCVQHAHCRITASDVAQAWGKSSSSAIHRTYVYLNRR
jgi:hypothetical protein